MVSDDRIAALEEALAHQTRALEELDEVVRGQWREIEALRREVKRLEQRFEEAADAEGGSAAEPLPPHY